jgi:XTP/dITP diphosphohydrolase
VQVAVLSPLDPQPLISIGRVQGEITLEAIGDGGFGFDPVMWIPSLGQTMAQLDPAHKNQISHRGQSARQMVALIQESWLQK